MTTILAVFAHPDDEAFGVGGTLAKYAEDGHRVLLVNTTKGESGQNRLDQNDRDRMGELREVELQRACEQLGIEPPIFLGYRDSGMAGTPANEHPDALHQADLDEVATRVLDVIQRERPDIVITFEHTGWYGHPDHIKTYQAVRRAYELLPSDNQPTLICAVFAAEAARYSARLMEEAGLEVPNMFRDRERMRYSLDVIPIVIDVTAQAEKKIAALNEHRTQMGPRAGLPSRFSTCAPAGSTSCLLRIMMRFPMYRPINVVEGSSTNRLRTHWFRIHCCRQALKSWALSLRKANETASSYRR